MTSGYFTKHFFCWKSNQLFGWSVHQKLLWFINETCDVYSQLYLGYIVNYGNLWSYLKAHTTKARYKQNGKMKNFS